MPPSAVALNGRLLPEQIGLLLLILTVGTVFTLNEMALEAVMQVLLDKLDTSGPTRTL